MKQPLTREHHEAIGPQFAATRNALVRLEVATRNGHYSRDVVEAVVAAKDALDLVRTKLDSEFIDERELAGEQVEKPGMYPHSAFYRIE